MYSAAPKPAVVRLREDPNLLDAYAGKFIHSNGTEQPAWLIDGVLVREERTARYMACTHSKCGSCADGLAEKSYTICPNCIEKKDRERVENYKKNAKTVLTEIPEPGVFCEELDQFFFTQDMDEILDELSLLGDTDTDYDIATLSFFGLKKDVRGVDLSELIGEDYEEGFELDDEGETIQAQINSYCEKHALYLPDYSVWVKLEETHANVP